MTHLNKHLLIASFILASCSITTEQDIPSKTIEQLSGSWANQEESSHIYFYKDKTAKLVFPKHQPPIKLISPYQAVKENKIGIALGGFWSGPVLIDITQLNNAQTITVRIPNEKAIIFHKIEPK
jgi:hypothetical protein